MCMGKIFLLSFVLSMITRSQPPSRISSRVASKLMRLVRRRSRGQGEVHQMGYRSPPFPTIGRLHGRLYHEVLVIVSSTSVEGIEGLSHGFSSSILIREPGPPLAFMLFPQRLVVPCSGRRGPGR